MKTVGLEQNGFNRVLRLRGEEVDLVCQLSVRGGTERDRQH